MNQQPFFQQFLACKVSVNLTFEDTEFDNLVEIGLFRVVQISPRRGSRATQPMSRRIAPRNMAYPEPGPGEKPGEGADMMLRHGIAAGFLRAF